MKATAQANESPISFKHSIILCNMIRGKRLNRAKDILEDLVNKKIDADGRYYTTAARKFLEILNAVESNAKVKEMDADKLFIKKIKADTAFTFGRPRSRWKLRGRVKKSTNITIEVEQL